MSKKKCQETLSFGDDQGDNSTTICCQGDGGVHATDSFPHYEEGVVKEIVFPDNDKLKAELGGILGVQWRALLLSYGTINPHPRLADYENSWANKIVRVKRYKIVWTVEEIEYVGKKNAKGQWTYRRKK